MKKIAIVLTLLFTFQGLIAQNKALNLDKGFVQVHKRKETVNPLLFKNKGVAKPISVMPWAQKEIVTLTKGKLLYVAAYAVNNEMYYLYFVGTKNSEDKDVISIYEVDEKGNTYIIFSKNSDEYDQEPAWQTDYIYNNKISYDHIYFGTAYTTDVDAALYKYRYKLGSGHDIEQGHYLKNEHGYLGDVYNHTGTVKASTYFGDLSIQIEDTKNEKSVFVVKEFEGGFMIGNLTWSENDKILYFSNHSKDIACIWRYDIDSKELSKIIPEHEADLPFAFNFKKKEHIIYVENNSIKVAVSPKNDQSIDVGAIDIGKYSKKTDTLKSLQLIRLKTFPIKDTEIEQIKEVLTKRRITFLNAKKTIADNYTYAFGLKEIDKKEGTFQAFSVSLLENNQIQSEINFKDWSSNNACVVKEIDNIKIAGYNAVYKIEVNEDSYGYSPFSAIFLRKGNQLTKGLFIKPYLESDYGFTSSRFVQPTNSQIKNQIWVEKSIGSWGFGFDKENYGEEEIIYYTKVDKYIFKDKKFRRLDNKKENIYYYVNALSGLRGHSQPYIKSTRLELLPYGTKVKLIAKTRLKLEIDDHGEILKGHWVLIGAKDDSGKTYYSYVFDEYLSKEKPSDAINWKWYFYDGQLGESGQLVNKLKEGKWKWFYKNGNKKAIGQYENGKAQGERKWYYPSGEMYCLGEYDDGEKTGKWIWYYKNKKIRNTITFANGTVKDISIFDTLGNLFVTEKVLDKVSVNFINSFEYSKEFDLEILNENGISAEFYDDYYYFGRKKEGKKIGKWKSYRSGDLKGVKKYKNDLLDGEQFSYYDNGQVEQEYIFTNGKPTGKWILYSRDGKIKNITYYQGNKTKSEDYIDGKLVHVLKSKNNLSVSSRKFFLDGKIKEAIDYKKGKKHGTEKMYYKNGILKKIQHYKNGTMHGAFKFFYEDGNIMEEGIYKNGKHKEIAHYKKGELTHLTIFYDDGIFKKVTTFANDLKDGEEKEYYNNKRLKNIYNYKAGNLNGKYVCYYENGQIEISGNYINNLLDGEKKEYYKNGQVKNIEHYTLGERDGRCTYYKENGIITTDEEFRRNLNYITGKWKYYKNGQLKSVELYHRKGVVEWKYYFPNGKLKEIRQYEYQGIVPIEVGTWKYYYPSGKIRRIKTFDNDKTAFYHENGALYRVNKYTKSMNLVSCFDNQENSLDKGTLKDGTGTVNEYNEKGELLNIATYKNGVLDDKSLSFDKIDLNSKNLNEVAWNIFLNETDIIKLNQAIKWIKLSIQFDKNYYNMDTYASLLYKIGKYKEALVIAKEAIEIAKNNKRKIIETEDLLKLIEAKLK